MNRKFEEGDYVKIKHQVRSRYFKGNYSKYGIIKSYIYWQERSGKLYYEVNLIDYPVARKYRADEIEKITKKEYIRASVIEKL
jgi:hypothetical protein